MKKFADRVDRKVVVVGVSASLVEVPPSDHHLRTYKSSLATPIFFIPDLYLQILALTSKKHV